MSESDMPGVEHGAIDGQDRPGVTTIFIADHSEIVLAGLKQVVSNQKRFRLAGAAKDGESALQEIDRLRPDVVLLNEDLPGGDGIRLMRKLKEAVPGLRILVVSSSSGDDLRVFAALIAGADGYCMQNVSVVQLMRAIETVSMGGAWLDSGVASRVLRSCGSHLHASPQLELTPAARMAKLSLREVAVLVCIVDGLQNADIGHRLGISVETVKVHVSNIMHKLTVNDRTQLAVKALREGLI